MARRNTKTEARGLGTRNTKRRRAGSPAKRITEVAGERRNTPRPRLGLSKPSAVHESMKASAQLDAFPTSDNARARQSAHKKAVVSIRLTGEIIAKLDAEAKRANDDRGKTNGVYRSYASYSWSKVTRNDVVEKAIKQWLARGAS